MTQGTAVKLAEGIEIPVPSTWELDPAHTTVGFVARHLMVTKVRGRFTKFTGSVHVAEKPLESRAEVAIEAASIDTANEMRDAHLRSPDFLDVGRFPTIRFSSSSSTMDPSGRTQVVGDLTIRDLTRPVALDVVLEGTISDPSAGTRVAFTATGEIDREAFGMTWNRALESGGLLVGKRVRLEIEGVAVLQA